MRKMNVRSFLESTMDPNTAIVHNVAIISMLTMLELMQANIQSLEEQVSTLTAISGGLQDVVSVILHGTKRRIDETAYVPDKKRHMCCADGINSGRVTPMGS